jgi:hypothetical protein
MATERRRPALWYIRRGTIVQGPFPAGLISRYVVLGRIVMTDELSEDLVTWKPLGELPWLIPDFVRGDGVDPQKLLTARRWEDERTHIERRRERTAMAEERRHLKERRQKAGSRGRPPRTEDAFERMRGERRQRAWALAIASGMLVLVLAFVSLHEPPPAGGGFDCRRPARPAVVWDNCAMEGRALVRVDLSDSHMRNMALSGADLRRSVLKGADLSFTNLSVARLQGADLRGAKLTGASLRGADLEGADLEGADLSYANLYNARIERVRLDGARLDHAVWVDGSLCTPGSLGRCVTR